MPRNRTEPNRYWSKEEKLRRINRVLVDGLRHRDGVYVSRKNGHRNHTWR